MAISVSRCKVITTLQKNYENNALLIFLYSDCLVQLLTLSAILNIFCFNHLRSSTITCAKVF